MTRKPSGFTLLEVLLAFAILVTGLTLVLQIFGRHLNVVQSLSSSLTALHLADEQLIGEALQREQTLTSTSTSPENFIPSIKVDPIHFDQDPLKNFTLDQVTADVSWEARRESRLTRMKTGFQSKSGP